MVLSFMVMPKVVISITYIYLKNQLNILEIRPRGHVTSFFSEYQVIPIKMLFKYCYLLLFNNTLVNGELEIQTPAITATRSKEKFAPTIVEGRGHC